MTKEERMNAILDANKIYLSDDNQMLRQVLTDIRDLAYRGIGSPADALQAIHERANRVLRKVGP